MRSNILRDFRSADVIVPFAKETVLANAVLCGYYVIGVPSPSNSYLTGQILDRVHSSVLQAEFATAERMDCGNGYRLEHARRNL